MPHALKLECLQARAGSCDCKESNLRLAEPGDIEADILLGNKDGFRAACSGAVILLKTRKGRGTR
jgi:hypothetical protein